MGSKQSEIPGTERPRVKEVDDAAQGYIEQRDKRIRLSVKEKAAKDALITVMKKHKLTVYRDEDHGFTVTLDELTNVEGEQGQGGRRGVVAGAPEGWESLASTRLSPHPSTHPHRLASPDAGRFFLEEAWHVESR